MNSDRWSSIQSIFNAAVDLPADEQRIYIEGACAGDESLKNEVWALLEEDAHEAPLLNRGVASLAVDVLGGAPAPFHECGPYRIRRVLGEGGMGVVYLAERPDLHSLAAIKTLRDAWVSPSRRERFLSEQRTLAQLNHPCIARLYDADTLPDGTPWFAMEYVEGVPLTAFCKKAECSIEERLRLFRAACEAIQYAHSQAIIHRDLKPSNILVKPDGSVRLLDFGIAKQVDDLGLAVDQTVTGLRFMTPAYAAPEQIRGQAIGIQTDVYSLGVILYELLSGRLPFDLTNCTPAEMAAVITEQVPAKPSSVARQRVQEEGANPRVLSASKMSWADLDVLCLTAMHKDVERRYRSVEALIRDIDHYLKSEPLEARPDSATYRLRKLVNRNRRTVLTSATALALVIGLVVFFTARLAIARNAALAQAARTERIQKFMTNLFQGGDAAAGPAEALRVITLVDRGVQEAQLLNADPEVQAELYETLGTIYQKLGKLDRANTLLTKALAQRRALFGNSHPQVAESLAALGLLRDDQAQWPEAERLAREALAIDQRDLSSKDPGLGRPMTVLGKVLEDRGSYDAAIKMLEQAVELQSAKKAPTPELAASLYELASTHFYAGHYSVSESLNERVLLLYRQIYGNRHPLVADVLINLGAIKFDLGHYAAAEKFDRQAVDIVQSWYGQDNPVTASDLTILARALVFENRYAEAMGLVQQSLAIKERVYGNVHPSVASSLNELGQIATRQGDYGAAAQYFARMVSIYREIYGEHHYLFAIALSNLGSVYLARHEWDRAEPIYRRVVRLFTETQSATHINTGIARIKLGNALLGEHRYVEAEVESRAGYDILIKQMDPSVSWLVHARRDLAEIYDHLNQPEQAARYRAELRNTSNPKKIAGRP